MGQVATLYCIWISFILTGAKPQLGYVSYVPLVPTFQFVSPIDFRGPAHEEHDVLTCTGTLELLANKEQIGYENVSLSLEARLG